MFGLINVADIMDLWVVKIVTIGARKSFVIDAHDHVFAQYTTGLGNRNKFCVKFTT